MTLPEGRVRVEAAFSSNPADPSPLWVDITEDVLGRVTMSRGRSDEFSSVEPGRLAAMLDNANGDYTWNNPSSRFYPGVLPGRRVRVLFEVPDPPAPPPTPESRVRLFGVSIVPTPSDPVGSLPPGQTSYPVPSGAYYVATTGSDSTGTGAVGTPWATLGKAVATVPAGATIVMREGSYHEGASPGSRGNGVSVGTANLTVQSYPGEEVWLDGSSVLASWTLHATGVWKHAWAHTFDRSGTYSWGGSTSGILVDPAYPLASYPEQFWADSTALEQVATLGEVAAGKFYVDLAADLVYIGTDPTGKTMRGADLCAALTVLGSGAGFTGRGFGVRKYATQCPDFGAIKLNRANCTLEHVWVEDCSAGGIWTYNGTTASHNLTMRRVTATRCGQMGFGGTQADDVLIEGCAFPGNNTSRFASGQSAGNVKITRAKRWVFRGCTFDDCVEGNGLWFDQSCIDFDVISCTADGCEDKGFFTENCTTTRYVDCVSANNLTGFHILGTDNVDMWNCTATNCRELLVVEQDTRTPANTPANLDSRYPNDPDVDWYINSFRWRNGILGKTTTGVAHFRVKSSGLTPPREWSTYGVTSDGNLFNRASGSGSLVTLTTAAGEVGYSWASYQSTTGQDAGSLFIDGSDGLDALTYLPTSATRTALAGVGVPLPADIAALVGQPTGTVYVGHWPR